MEQKIIYKDIIDEYIKIHKHGNTMYCNQNMLEINPCVGCQFQCQYCNAYTQEEKTEFSTITIYKKYPEYFEAFLKNNSELLKSKFFYFSPKVDAFQDILIEEGITKRILELLEKYSAKYFILTKGKTPPKDIQELLIRSKHNNQVIISCSMPNENIRQRLEVNAPSIKERLEFAKFCVDNEIVTTAIFSPILPVENLEFVKNYITQYIEMGISHFRVDFTEISRESLKKLINILPEYKSELESIYLDPEAEITHWKIPFTNKTVDRYWPSIKFMKKAFIDIENHAKALQKDATISVCNSIGTPQKIGNINEAADKRGFCCIGARF